MRRCNRILGSIRDRDCAVLAVLREVSFEFVPCPVAIKSVVSYIGVRTDFRFVITLLFISVSVRLSTDQHIFLPRTFMSLPSDSAASWEHYIFSAPMRCPWIYLVYPSVRVTVANRFPA